MLYVLRIAVFLMTLGLATTATADYFREDCRGAFELCLIVAGDPGSPEYIKCKDQYNVCRDSSCQQVRKGCMSECLVSSRGSEELEDNCRARCESDFSACVR